MRAIDSRIKEAILHPESEVRASAVAYFAGQPERDETVMPLVIEAVEKYGRDQAFGMLRIADELPQTEATVRWLTGELSADWDLEEIWQDNYCMAVGMVLCEAGPGLLEARLAELPYFPQELRPWLDERIEMTTWDWATGWKALEDLCREARKRGGFSRSDSGRGSRIIESLARHADAADEVLSRLRPRRSGHAGDLANWMEPLIIDLAGRMRLEAAVPNLVERMKECDYDVTDSCLAALEDINGDRVVEYIAGQWLRGDEDFRMLGASALEDIHTDLKVRKCIEFLAAEESIAVADFLANALLASFAEEAIAPVRELVQGDWDDLDPDEQDLRHRLVVVATVTGVSFPEYEAWYDHARKTEWGWAGFERDRLRVNFDRDDEDEWYEDFEEEDFDEEESDEDDWGDDLEDDWGIEPQERYDEDPYSPDLEDGEDDSYTSSGAVQPVRREQPRVGRNDPCPCGSGKKYKKCCLKKGKDEPPL